MNKSKLHSRLTILNIINDSILSNKPLRLIYEKYFSKTKFSNVDRRFITEVSKGTIRMFKRIDFELSRYYKGKLRKLEIKYLNILRMAVYQIRYMNKIPSYAIVSTSVEITKKMFPKYSSITNGLLRNMIENSLEIQAPTDKDSVDYISKYYSHPEWLVQKWFQEYGFSSLIALLEYNNKPPKTWFRYNNEKINFSSIKELLGVCDENISQHDYLDNFFSISSNLSELFDHDIFFKKDIMVQSLTNGLIIKLLNPVKGEEILDICAAPGGKTLSLSQSVGLSGRVHSYDIDLERIKTIFNNVKNYNVKNVSIEHADVSIHELKLSKKMMIDVPCLGTGTIAKNADLRWKKKREDLRALARSQEDILRNCSKYLKPNGILVYSTCSIEDEENWMIIDKFLHDYPNYKIDNANKFVDNKFTDNRGAINIKPYTHNIDGGFAVRLVNNAC